MLYREIEPESSLADLVQVLTVVEAEAESDVYPRGQILPDGIVELVFHYGQPFVTFRNDGTHYKQPQGFLISQMRESIEIESDGEIGFVAARFFPWGASHFFDLSVNSFLDDCQSTERVWPDVHHQLLEQLSTAYGWEGRIELLQEFLKARLNEFRRTDTSIDEVLRFCRAERGQITVEQLCDRFAIPKKQMERRFVQVVGTTPKTFLRVTRFLDVCSHLADFNDRTLTDVAHHCGYYDQAHFIRDFKQFSGFTPKQFFAKHNISFADI